MLTAPETFPIVGSFYRPPAKSILETIPVGARLTIRAEPTNAFDPNAIAVWIQTTEIPASAHKALLLSGATSGFRLGDDRAEDAESWLETILLADSWHLGYIPAITAKTPAARRMIAAGPVAGQFLIVDGKPAFSRAPADIIPLRRQIELPTED